MSLFTLKSWQTRRVHKKIDQLNRTVLNKLKKENYNPLEYGNLRKGDIWGEISDGIITWSYNIDVIIGKPITYLVTYNIEKKEFSCYAKTAKTNFSNILQFTTHDFSELSYRLDELAFHIPSLRERMLREYLYSESRRGPRKKWFTLFTKGDQMTEHLESVILNLILQSKISENEAARLRIYANNLSQ